MNAPRHSKLLKMASQCFLLALLPVASMAATSRIAAGNAHAVAIKADGTLWQWGYMSSVPRLIGSGYTSVSAGTWFAVAIKADGTMWSWGQNSSWGQLGNGTYSSSDTPKQIGSGFVNVASGSFTSIATKHDGTLWGWGQNEGKLADGTHRSSLVPKMIGAEFSSVSLGLHGVVASKTDGTLWYWGARSYLPIQTPTSVSDFVSVSTGSSHSMAITTDGSLWAWGENSKGQLGDGSTTRSVTPKKIGTGFARVSTGSPADLDAGDSFTVAIKTDGTLWAWGRNQHGQLGDGTMEDSLVPKLIGSGFSDVAAGDAFTIATKTDGSLWGWGRNHYGQLGDGTTTDSLVPKQIFADGFEHVSHRLTCIFDWAERSYPIIFPAGGVSGSGSGFVYRHYPASGNFLGQEQSSGRLVALGTVTENTMLDLGPAESWAITAGCP